MSSLTQQLAYSFLKQETKAATRLLEELDPIDIVHFLDHAPQEQVTAVMREIQPSVCAAVLNAADTSKAVLWTSDIAANLLSSILRHMDKSEQGKLLDQLSLKRKTACQLLLTYKSDSIGAWVESDVPVFPDDMSVEEVIKRLVSRSYKDDRVIIIVDEHHSPIGRVSYSVLMRSAKSLKINNLLDKKINLITGGMTLSSAIRHPVWQSNDMAVVVNRQKEFLGVIWHRQIRKLLARSTKSFKKSQSNDTAQDLLRAYSDTMNGLFETVRESID